MTRLSFTVAQADSPGGAVRSLCARLTAIQAATAITNRLTP